MYRMLAFLLSSALLFTAPAAADTKEPAKFEPSSTIKPIDRKAFDLPLNGRGKSSIGGRLTVVPVISTSHNFCRANKFFTLKLQIHVGVKRVGIYDIDYCIVRTLACRGTGRLNVVHETASARPC